VADQKDTTNFYDNLGGINQKASDYAVGRAQFLDIRNLDFDVPNALQKRPGSTQAVSAGTSGAVSSVFEFVKLSGESYVVAGSDTAMFYLAVNTYTLLDSGWNNGQSTDMLTFVNKLWMANGQKFKWWDGTSLQPAGLPAQNSKATYAPGYINNYGISQMYVGGATMNCITTLYPNALVVRGVYVAYAYVRTDGYLGPIEFLRDARNIVVGTPTNNNADYFTESATEKLYGFSLPNGYAISGVAVYIATDTVTSSSSRTFVNGIGNVRAGNIGWLENTGFNFQRMSISLLPSADTSRFHYFTTIPSSNLYLTNYNGVTLWSATFSPGASFFDTYSSQAAGDAFSGMAIDWFSTYTPKYIEQNQNVMFYAGFSSAPSTVWFTELGQPEQIEPDYNFEVRTNDGDRIYATKTYNNQLLVLKENSFSKVVGDNPDNFQLVELSQQFGCLSNKTVIEFKEDLVWLDTRGIVRFNGASWDLISTPVEDVFRRLNISVAKEKAVAVHYKYRNQVWFGIPVDNSSVNNLTVVWDYLIEAWTFFEGFNLASSLK